MLKIRNNSYSTSFLDMIMNMLCAFIILFLILSLCINPKKLQEEKLKLHAEFIISMSWPAQLTDDVDMWVRDPLGNMVWFSQKEKGLLHLDRDDLGNRNDEILDTQGNKVVFNCNREIVTIRGIVPGEYTVNCHLFRKEDEKIEIPVTIELAKLNPYVIVKQSKQLLITKGEEKTAFRFTLDVAGNVKDINSLSISLIKNEVETINPFNPPLTPSP